MRFQKTPVKMSPRTLHGKLLENKGLELVNLSVRESTTHKSWCMFASRVVSIAGHYRGAALQKSMNKVCKKNVLRTKTRVELLKKNAALGRV